jgi:D-alanine--poly(phosphoribitol) ligase subunit 1
MAKLLLEKIYKHVKRNPERTAVISGNKSISYGDLWELSERLAKKVTALRPGDRSPIMVLGQKDLLMPVSFLACAKSGHAYVPVDISMPIGRIRDIEKSLDKPLVIITEEIDFKTAGPVLRKSDLENICLRDDLNSVSLEDMALRPDETFYIIFTSGSTGKPKGVEISEKALSNFTDWSGNLAWSCADKEGAVFLNQAPFSFDLSVMDLYTSLTSGGSLYCLSDKMLKDSAKLPVYLKESKAEYWVSTPSFAELCMAYSEFDRELLPNLRAFIFCGEKLPASLVLKLKERFKAKIINTYGPTESTVAVTGMEITEAMALNGEVPIGRVKAGSEIEIDKKSGEIIIKGNTLFKGYYKDSERTEKALFIDDEGRKSYHSGDRGYFREGILYYIGRMDNQVKLHGYRIELGDIEENIMKLDQVKGAVVLPKVKDGKIQYLAAFVTGPEDSRKSIKELKEGLKERIPAYMIPKRIFIIKDLPMTLNGKTDRKKLETYLYEAI